MKKNTKRIIALASIAAVVILLATMPLLAKQDTEEAGPKASILSGEVSVGNIDRELIGGGTLAEENAVEVAIPTAVKLKEFLVSNGDEVSKGTALASVDRVTVMTAISQVQQTLEYLSEEIEAAGKTDDEETVTALAGGTVKLLYAQEGDSVQQVMLEHGALAVLSLDGLMAVDLETDSDLPSGTAVTLTLSDGKTAEGKIVKNLAGAMTVTVADKNYAIGEQVQITGQDGAAIGSGVLYIYSPWNATAYAGTVKSVRVSAGDQLSAGKTLMVLTDVGYSAAYRQLVAQRQEYEELMLQLFAMYQTETVTAPCDGVVYGIDENSVQLLSQWGQSYSVSLLANAPNGNDGILYSNYLGKVTAVANNGWVLQIDPQPVQIADYKELTGVVLDETLMTQTVLHTQIQIPIFALSEGEWTTVDSDDVKNGDILLFASDSEGNLVWSVRMQEGQQQPGGSGQPEGPSGDGGSGKPDTTPDFEGMPGGSFGNMGTMPEEEEKFELYGLDMTQIATVTAHNQMTLDITVDELDVKALRAGMSAQVKIDALGGEKYTATITDIGNVGENNGGSSKYTVQLTMDRAENMLAGMNATATIVLSSENDVLTIPASALVEDGNETVVYTGYDKENDTLLDPVTVKVGSSDGETVEILEGLVNGQTYYYAYYDTLEISYTPDFGSGGLFGR